MARTRLQAEATQVIELLGGKQAFVDAVDHAYLSQWRWSFEARRKTGYAYRKAHGRRGRIYMHRSVAERRRDLIADCDVDHVDGDGLNNRRCNLRPATRSQNNANGCRPKNNTSGYKGVYPHSLVDKWVAQIGVAGKRVYLGLYTDPRDAARAYNQAAVQHFGDFARLNSV